MNEEEKDKIYELVKDCLWALETEDKGFYEPEYVVNSDDFMKEIKRCLDELNNKI